MSIVLDDELLFYGQDGAESCDRFISRVMHHAFSNGKLRDYSWMADLASTGIRGEAMRWWMELEDEVQMDWKKLRSALVERYSQKSEPPPLTASGIPTPAAAPPNRARSRSPPPTSGSPELPVQARTGSASPSRERSLTPTKAWSVVQRDSDDLSRDAGANGTKASGIKTIPFAVRKSSLNDANGARSSSPNKAWFVVKREPDVLSANVDGTDTAATTIGNPFMSATGPPLPVITIKPAARLYITEWSPRGVLKRALPSCPLSEEAWLQEARKRRAAYDKVGPGELTSVHWILVNPGESIPEHAIETGVEESGEALFSMRVWYEGGLHPGKAGRHLAVPFIPFRDDDVPIRTAYEVLVGNTLAVRWISNPCTPKEVIGANAIKMKAFHAVEGGVGTDGYTPLLVTQAYLTGRGLQPGKVGVYWAVCEIGFGSNKHQMSTFRILVWAE